MPVGISFGKYIYIYINYKLLNSNDLPPHKITLFLFVFYEKNLHLCKNKLLQYKDL